MSPVLQLGGPSEAGRALQAATNRRLRARGLGSMAVEENGVIDAETLLAVRKAAWLLGALKKTCDTLVETGEIPLGVQRMIVNPGARNPKQKERAKKRLAALRQEREEREAQAAGTSPERRAIVKAAKKAAAHYRNNPHAYHYLMKTEIANTIIMRPTPRNYRSDCSQFVVNVYREAGIRDCPGSGSYLYSGTATIAEGGTIVHHPKPGDLGMYAHSMADPRGTTHHVELYIGEAGCMFIGHGSPPIDSDTPGQPDFYLSFLP